MLYLEDVGNAAGRFMDLDRLFQYINDAVSCTFSDTEYARIHAKRNAAVQIAVATAAFILLMRMRF